MANPVVTFEMENGDIMKAELYPEIAPNTVKNFVSLVKKGFYDGLTFHRVISGFMIQGGCPVNQRSDNGICHCVKQTHHCDHGGREHQKQSEHTICIICDKIQGQNVIYIRCPVIHREQYELIQFGPVHSLCCRCFL